MLSKSDFIAAPSLSAVYVNTQLRISLPPCNAPLRCHSLSEWVSDGSICFKMDSGSSESPEKISKEKYNTRRPAQFTKPCSFSRTYCPHAVEHAS